MKEYELNTYKQRRTFWEELVKERGHPALEKGLSTLHPDSARVLRWHYFEGYSLKEIVSLLGKSISIVRNHHNRGIFRLQQYYLDFEKKSFNSVRSF